MEKHKSNLKTTKAAALAAAFLLQKKIISGKINVYVLSGIDTNYVMCVETCLKIN